jgi:uroporphyrinogen-III synthase
LAAPAVPRPDVDRVSCVIVTRPAQEAAKWVQALTHRGWPATALPLIEITEPSDASSRAMLQQHRIDWWRWDALMFVSAAAVRHFFAQGVERPPAGPLKTRFWAPGPGTARALADALSALGLEPGRIDAPAADAAQFDSEHLWPVVAHQLVPGAQVLIVRGLSSDADEAPAGAAAGSGRDWLIRRCEAAGVRVQACVAYERRTPVWLAAQRASASAAAAPGHLWLFSSSEAVAHLRQLVPDGDWGPAAALATHPRIADAARAAGFGTVIETRPALPDVLRSLESTTRHE